MEELYLCADVGGTQIKTGVLDQTGELHGELNHVSALANLPKDRLLDHLAETLIEAAGTERIHGVRLAMPGPFDYPKGVCLIQGLSKYSSLYGVNLKESLEKRLESNLGGAARNILFCNDVSAFALGELYYGCAKETERAMFVCIGTGCGSAFSICGKLVDQRTPGVPPDGYIYPFPFYGRRIDDVISRRGLQELAQRYVGKPLEGKELAELAYGGDTEAIKAYASFGKLLAKAVTPFLESFLPDLLCLGGQVTASSSLFLGPLSSACEKRGIRLSLTQDTSLRAVQGLLQIKMLPSGG